MKIPFVTRSEFDEHVSSNNEKFATILNRFDVHDRKVDERHAENKADAAALKNDVAAIKGSLAAIDGLMPAIKAGIHADAKSEYRKKLARTIVRVILATLLTVSGLIPLAQWLIGLKITVHFGGA